MEIREDIQISVTNVIIKLRKENKSYGKNGNIFNLSRSNVQTVVRNYKENYTTEYKVRTGRPKILSRREVNCILKEIRKQV